jgi:EmrB/QacA subfamily drug resistance transporter
MELQTLARLDTRPDTRPATGPDAGADTPAAAGPDARPAQLIDGRAPTPGTDVLSPAALLVLLLGFSLSVIDFFIVNVALPTMGHDLHAPDAILELVVAGYGLTYALLLVLGGRLGDSFGRRRLFLGGMTVFTVASLLCGVAPSVAVLIVARVLQGSAAALMVPQVLATVQATTEGPRRAKAVGMYGATAGISMVIGQILGGVIVWANVAGSGWRGIFLVNVPIGAVALVLARRILPETRSARPSRIDGVGTVLLAATLLCLLLPLTEGSVLGWPVWVWVLLALVPLGAFCFIRFEKALEARGRVPLVPPVIVALGSMRTGLTIVLPFFTAFGGFMFVYAVGSQDGLGLSALAAGTALAPLALAFFLASLLAARAVQRFGVAVATVGALLQGLGLAVLGVLVLTGWPHMSVPACLAALAVAGFGQGLVVSPLFRVVLSEVPGHLAGAGAGVLTTSQQASLALGVALVGTLFVTCTSDFGYRDSAALILGLLTLVAVAVARRSRSLPELD